MLLRADDRNWNSGSDVQWNNPATWAEGAVPTADDNVILSPASSIYIARGVDAVAKTVAFSNTVNIQSIYINDGGSLTVGGAIIDPGAGSAYFRVNNSTLNRADRVLTATSLAAQEVSLIVGTGPQYLTTGYDMTLSSWINVNAGNVAYGHIFRQTNGVISIANGDSSYSLVLMESYTQPTAGSYGRFILDGGTLKAERIGVGNGNGNNTGSDHYAGKGYFEFNNGTVQPRTSGGTVSFHNGSAFENYNGSGTKDMQFNTSKPTTVELAQNGTHTFNADGSAGTIIISPSAQVVDKTGESGTILKTGAGDLVFTGGGLAATNTWSGDTTVTAGRVRVNYGTIADAAGSLALNDAYRPVSKLILNGGGFDLTGRANATNSNFNGLSIPVGTYRPLTLTLPSTAGLAVGQRALNTYLPTNSYIRRILSGTQVELNTMSTSTSAQTDQTIVFEAAAFGGTQTVNHVELDATSSTVSVTPAGSGTLLNFGCGTMWQAVMLYGDVVVTGSVPSVIRAGPGAYNAINLTSASAPDGGMRAFRVDDVTGDTNVDLTVSANLWNRTGDLAYRAGVLKTGAGTLLLSAPANMYNGATVVSNGTLLVCGAGGITGSVVTVVSGACFGAYGTNVARRVAGLTLDEGSKLVWTYDGDAHKAGSIDVLGTLNLPAEATLDVGGSGFLYSGQTLISAQAVGGATDLSGWTITGAPKNSRVGVVGNDLTLIVSRGTLLRLQ